jgi:hypothetical protein
MSLLSGLQKLDFSIGGALIVLWIYGMLTKKANLISHKKLKRRI